MVDWSAPPHEASDKRLLYELVMGLLVATAPAIQPIGNWTISLAWFGIGVLLATVFYVSLFTTPVQKFNKLTDTSTGGGIVAVVIMAIIIWGSIWLFTPPIYASLSIILGGCVILAIAPALRLLKRFNSRKRRHLT